VQMPPNGKNPRIPSDRNIAARAVLVFGYFPVCNRCFTTSKGTREKEAKVFPIAADAAIPIVVAALSEMM